MIHKTAKLSIFGMTLLFLFAGLSAVYAEEVSVGSDVQSGGVGSVPAVTSQKQVPSSVSPVMDSGNITMEFKKADIKSVLNLLARKGKVNIVIDEDVIGPVTMRLVDVPWDKAMDVVIRSGGYVYEKDSNIYRITTPEKLEREELKTRVFPLVYATALDIMGGTDEASMRGIKGLLTDRGSIRYDERSNVLIVNDTASTLTRIADVIEELDTETRQVVIEAKLVETTLDSNEDLGINWNIEATASGTQVPWTFPFPSDGLNWTHIPRGDPAASGPAFQPTEGQVGSMPYAWTDTSNAFGGFNWGTLNASNLAATLEVLFDKRDTKILSNPTITTLDNMSANIVVGRQDPVPSYSFNSDTGSWEVAGFYYEESGVELDVTPQINKDDYITLAVHPRVRELIGTATFPSGGSTAEIPIFTVREATTTIIVPSGNTILIGGLIQRTTIEYEKKVPILGSIPLLGYLFKKTEEDEKITELIIFLTPTIAKGSRTEAEAREMFLPRTVREIAEVRMGKKDGKKSRKTKRSKRKTVSRR